MRAVDILSRKIQRVLLSAAEIRRTFIHSPGIYRVPVTCGKANSRDGKRVQICRLKREGSHSVVELETLQRGTFLGSLALEAAEENVEVGVPTGEAA